MLDKNSKYSYLTYTAFGNPDEKYLMSVKDQESNITTYSRNILGNPTQTSQANTGGNVVRNFAYGLYKNLSLDLSKPAFLVSETNPETGTITYVRDNVGNMKQRTDASGTATYTYDEINRLKNISKTVNNVTETIGFDYDNANNRTLLTSSAASITYTYDEVNRQKTKTETIAGKSYTTTYGYTANDIINSIIYPAVAGRTVSYGINPNNQVNSITGFVTNVSYYTTENAGIHAGLPSSYTFSNGGSNNVTTTPTYNNRQLITDISAGKASAPGAALTAHYDYDTRGNTTRFTSNVGNPQDFTYYDTSRLKTFNGTWASSGSFTYDAVGNRKTKNVGTDSTTYTINSGTNRLDSATGTEAASYSYNGNGSLSGGTWGGKTYTFDYNAYDKLTSVSSGGVTLASYGYDGDGMRVTKTVNGKTTVYHYDQGGNVISETESNGTLLTDYILLNGKLVAKVVNIPVISVTPASINFNNVYVYKTSSSQTVSVRNNGTGSLVIGTITLTGSNPTEFTVTTDACSGQTLAASASCTVQAKFSPTTTGTKNATISIPSNDPVKPTFTLSLNGIGILPTLTVSNPGTGTGTVTSSPGGISCGSVCSASFATDTPVTLDTSLDTYSLFVGWGGACSGTNPSCSVIMDSNKSVTATFDVKASQIAGTFYPSPQDAYNSASTGDIIYAWDVTFANGLVCDRLDAPDVTILGGYDPIYSTVTGMTKLSAPLIIQKGSIRVSNLAIVDSGSQASTLMVQPAIMSSAITTLATTATSGPALIRAKDGNGKKHRHDDDKEHDRDSDHDHHEEHRDGHDD